MGFLLRAQDLEHANVEEQCQGQTEPGRDRGNIMTQTHANNILMFRCNVYKVQQRLMGLRVVLFGHKMLDTLKC